MRLLKQMACISLLLTLQAEDAQALTTKRRSSSPPKSSGAKPGSKPASKPGSKPAGSGTSGKKTTTKTTTTTTIRSKGGSRAPSYDSDSGDDIFFDQGPTHVIVNPP